MKGVKKGSSILHLRRVAAMKLYGTYTKSKNGFELQPFQESGRKKGGKELEKVGMRV